MLRARAVFVGPPRQAISASNRDGRHRRTASQPQASIDVASAYGEVATHLHATASVSAALSARKLVLAETVSATDPSNTRPPPLAVMGDIQPGIWKIPGFCQTDAQGCSTYRRWVFGYVCETKAGQTTPYLIDNAGTFLRFVAVVGQLSADRARERPGCRDPTSQAFRLAPNPQDAEGDCSEVRHMCNDRLGSPWVRESPCGWVRERGRGALMHCTGSGAAWGPFFGGVDGFW